MCVCVCVSSPTLTFVDLYSSLYSLTCPVCACVCVFVSSPKLTHCIHILYSPTSPTAPTYFTLPLHPHTLPSHFTHTHPLHPHTSPSHFTHTHPMHPHTLPSHCTHILYPHTSLTASTYFTLTLPPPTLHPHTLPTHFNVVVTTGKKRETVFFSGHNHISCKIFFLEASIWRFENVYIICRRNPQLLIDSLVNVI